MFDCVDGAAGIRTNGGVPYESWRWGYSGKDDAAFTELLKTFFDAMIQLRTDGARKIVWRSRPVLEKEGDTTSIRMRLAALDGEGKHVRIQQTKDSDNE
jgi:hypothetical protein